ncbi:hypothetical protein [Thermoflexus hugenholtzii]
MTWWMWPIIIVGVLFVLAALERSVREIVRTLVQAPAQALAILQETSRRAAGTTWLQFQSAFRAATEGASWPGWPIIGTVVYFIIFLLALASDLGVLLLTLEAMGLIRISTYLRSLQGFLDLGMLTTLALLVSGAFFGLLSLDLLGITPFGVLWARAPRWFQHILRGTALGGVLFLLILFTSMGLWRFLRVAPPEVLRWIGPQIVLPLEGWTQLFLFIGLPLLMIVLTVLSGWSLGWMAALLWALLLFMMTIPTGLTAVLMFLTLHILDRLSVALDALLRSLAGAGRWLAHLVGAPLWLVLKLLVGIWNWLVSFDWLRKSLHLGSLDPSLPDRFAVWWETLFSGLWAREPEEEEILPSEREGIPQEPSMPGPIPGGSAPSPNSEGFLEPEDRTLRS